MKKHEPFEHEEYQSEFVWVDFAYYGFIVIVGIALAIIIFELVWGEALTAWMYR